MDLSFCELPDQPGLHGSKENLSLLGPLPGSFHMVQNPLDLRPGKIGINNQTGLILYLFFQSLLFQGITEL